MSPSLLRWELRPEPAGRRRLALGYAAAASGTAVGTAVLGVTIMVTRQCRSTGSDGFGCMAPFFHGLGLSIVGGLIATLTVAILLKLRLRFVLALLALAAPVLMATQLLSIFGVEPRPYALIAMVGVPAAASWISARLLPDQPSAPPAPEGSFGNTRVSKEQVSAAEAFVS